MKHIDYFNESWIPMDEEMIGIIEDNILSIIDDEGFERYSFYNKSNELNNYFIVYRTNLLTYDSVERGILDCENKLDNVEKILYSGSRRIIRNASSSIISTYIGSSSFSKHVIHAKITTLPGSNPVYDIVNNKASSIYIKDRETNFFTSKSNEYYLWVKMEVII